MGSSEDENLGSLSEILKRDPRNTMELLKLRLDFARKHFEFHARQRTTMFNFFLLVVGIILAAYGSVVREASVKYLGPYVALSGMSVCLAFLFIDLRNTHLLEYSEKIIAEIERHYLFANFRFTGADVRFRRIADGQLGTLYREELERDPKNWGDTGSPSLMARTGRAWIWFYNNFSKHKFWVRAVLILSFMGFFFLVIDGVRASEIGGARGGLFAKLGLTLAGIIDSVFSYVAGGRGPALQSYLLNVYGSGAEATGHAVARSVAWTLLIVAPVVWLVGSMGKRYRAGAK